MSENKKTDRADEALGQRPCMPNISDFDLGNPKHELFVLHYCDPSQPTYHNLIKSAYAAGYSRHSAKACAHDILRRPKVAAAVAAIDNYTLSRICADREALTLMLLEDRALAREVSQPAAAVSADKVLATMHGLLTEQMQVNSQGMTTIEVVLVPGQAPFKDDGE